MYYGPKGNAGSLVSVVDGNAGGLDRDYQQTPVGGTGGHTWTDNLTLRISSAGRLIQGFAHVDLTFQSR